MQASELTVNYLDHIGVCHKHGDVGTSRKLVVENIPDPLLRRSINNQRSVQFKT